MRVTNDRPDQQHLTPDSHDGDEPPPPLPARASLAQNIAPIHRPLKSSKQAAPLMSQGDVAPPIPSRAPVSARPQPSGKVLESNTGSPAKLVLMDVRRNSGPSVKVHQVSRSGRSSAASLPERTRSGVKETSGDLVALNHWPIRQSPPSQLPLEGGTPRAVPRHANEYVDSPTLTAGLANRPDPLTVTDRSSSLPEVFRPHGPGVNLRDCQEEVTRVRTPGSPANALKWTDKTTTTSGRETVCQEGIVCARCGRCRCSNCAMPRELPRRWVGECECSAESFVNVCTCMCCVRALFFHTRRSEDEDYSDEPCACLEQPACCLRWSTMSLLAFTCLPCLLCYLPARCALGTCRSCYNSYRIIGCRCEQTSSVGGQVSGTKGLLTPESESSSY